MIYQQSRACCMMPSKTRAERLALWQRFRGGKDGTLWYYRALADEFNHLMSGPIARGLEGTVAKLEALFGQPQPQ